MFRYLVAVFCTLSLGACGDGGASSQDELAMRTAQVKIVGGSESAFLAQYGDAWTKQASGLYSLADGQGRYQVAFGVEGTVAALQLALNDQANAAKSQMGLDKVLRKSMAQTEQAVTFWQQAVNSLAAASAESDLAGLTVTKVAGDCTVVATATINPGRSCYAAASAEYNGIVGPPPWGAVTANAGTDRKFSPGSRVSVDAFDTSPDCYSAFAAASICGISATALPW
jgi:hypothetical protein